MRLELSRRGDYAVRAMLALADPSADPWLSAARIASTMVIPERFLPRVMRDLALAGLVEARQGRTGGYRLARAASDITLLDVISAVEPPDETPRCILRGIPCGVDGRCAVHDVFGEARAALQERLAHASLSSVVTPRS
jgi:Rrf2 family protein